jgi:formyl-CoA transferase
VTGFGQTGPYAARAGFGSIGEAMGGLRYIVGEPDGNPSRVGISLGDALAGTMGAVGGLVALHARGRSGRGQVVDSASTTTRSCAACSSCPTRKSRER